MLHRMKNIADRQRRGYLRDRLAAFACAAALVAGVAVIVPASAPPSQAPPARTTHVAPSTAADSCTPVSIAARC